jgi:hypothetical protein
MSTVNVLDSPSKASLQQKRRHQVTPPTESHIGSSTSVYLPNPSGSNNREISSSQISLFDDNNEETIIHSSEYRCLFSWFHDKCSINITDSKSLTMNFLLKYKIMNLETLYLLYINNRQFLVNLLPIGYMMTIENKLYLEFYKPLEELSIYEVSLLLNNLGFSSYVIDLMKRNELNGMILTTMINLEEELKTIKIPLLQAKSLAVKFQEFKICGVPKKYLQMENTNHEMKSNSSTLGGDSPLPTLNQQSFNSSSSSFSSTAAMNNTEIKLDTQDSCLSNPEGQPIEPFDLAVKYLVDPGRFSAGSGNNGEDDTNSLNEHNLMDYIDFEIMSSIDEEEDIFIKELFSKNNNERFEQEEGITTTQPPGATTASPSTTLCIDTHFNDELLLRSATSTGSTSGNPFRRITRSISSPSMLNPDNKQDIATSKVRIFDFLPSSFRSVVSFIPSLL